MHGEPGRKSGKEGEQHAALWEGGGGGLVGRVSVKRAASGVPISELASLTS